MRITAEDREFLENRFERLFGWCDDEAAWLTCWLLNTLEAAGHAAPALEIGVYRGKYLSAIYQNNRRRNLPTYGLDTWGDSALDRTLEEIGNAVGHNDQIYLGWADSTRLDADSLSRIIRGARLGFVSVDGDHSAEAVQSDLKLVAGLMEPWGIIAVDDFLNCRAIGVGEGVYRFFHFDKPELLPFCYCTKKLFLARPEYVQSYADSVLDFSGACGHLPAVKEFAELKEHSGIQFVRQTLLGFPIWIIGSSV